MLKIMRAKDIRDALDKADAVEYLKKEFRFASHEEVYVEIRKVLPADASTIISKMKKQHKRAMQREIKITSGAEPVNVLMVNPNSVRIKQINEILQSMNNSRTWMIGGPLDIRFASWVGKEGIEKECATAEVEKGGVAEMNIVFPEGLAFCTDGIGMVPEASYEEMKKLEEELIIALAENEKNLKASRADTSAKYHEMERMKKAVEELKAEILSLIAQYEVVWNNYCASAEKTKREEAIGKVISEQLDETRSKLVKLQRISICVYSSGNVEVENAEIPDISDTDIFTEVSKLVATPFAGNFTVNELKGVAKLLLMVKTFREAGREVDVIFENHDLEDLWENING